MASLIRDMGLPIVIVSYAGLGAINHALLTVDAATIRGLEVRGIIFNRVSVTNYSLAELTNPTVINDLSGVPILGSLPDIEGLNMDNCQFGNLRILESPNLCNLWNLRISEISGSLESLESTDTPGRA